MIDPTPKEQFGLTSMNSETPPGYWGFPTSQTVFSRGGNAEAGLCDNAFCYPKNGANPCIMKVGGFGNSSDNNGICFGISALNICDPVSFEATETSPVAGRLAFVFHDAVTYDHSALTDALGDGGEAAEALKQSVTIYTPNTAYDRLDDTEGYRHVGWRIDGDEVDADAGFVKTTSHTAYSIWEPIVVLDHTQLTDIIGTGAEGVSDLPKDITISPDTAYPQLEDIAGFKLLEWRIDEEIAEPGGGFVRETPHTAYSVWIIVTLDHTELTDIVGTGAEGVSDLPSILTTESDPAYPQLEDIAGYRHVGWRIDGDVVDTDAEFDPAVPHTAYSVWEPFVVLDHSDLTGVIGEDAEGVSDLPPDIAIVGNTSYPQLEEVSGYRHVGWRIDGDTVGAEAGFVKTTPHTAYSVWSVVSMDHSDLKDKAGEDADGVSDLPTDIVIGADPTYPKLPDTAGYRHVGWEVDGETVEPGAAFIKTTPHEARSIWVKITDFIPIIPDDGDGEPIEVIEEKESEPWLGKNGKTVLLVAVLAAVIGELAVLTYSRRR